MKSIKNLLKFLIVLSAINLLTAFSRSETLRKLTGPQVFQKEIKDKLQTQDIHIDKNCINQKVCRTKEQVTAYAYNLSREFVKKIAQNEFYLNEVNIKIYKNGFSRFLLSLATKKAGPQIAFLFK